MTVPASTLSQEAKERYQDLFSDFEKKLNGEKSSEIHVVRRKAFDSFVAMGFPTTRDEEWRFTNITPITLTKFALPIPHALTDDLRRAVAEWMLDDAIAIVFVNGQMDGELSRLGELPPGVICSSLRSALKTNTSVVLEALSRSTDKDAFTALNTAFLLEGAFLSVPRGVVVDRPFQFLYVSTNTDSAAIYQPRNVILLGERSQATVVEMYMSMTHGAYLQNAATDIFLREGSVCRHDRIQEEGERAFHIGTVRIGQEARSTCTSNSINLGGEIVRNTVTAHLGAEGIECTLNGLSLGTANQLIDNHTTIDHAFPNCNSHELYKAVLDGQSKGVFNGKIFVRKDAQKTDAKQTNKTLLLSDDATIDTKPQLEIFADDVKCTHGATVGQLDENQVFYLRSRGIGESDARDLLTFAFASDVTNKVHVESLRPRLERKIHQRLDRGRKGA